MKKNVKLLTLCLIIIFIFLVGCQDKIDNTNNINVAGHADMDIYPDMAKVYVGISVLKPTAVMAQEEANSIINDIVDGLRYKGITEKDIETENLNLYEEKVWTENYSQTISMGWRATQTLKVKTSDLSKVGDIVDVAVNNGANQINFIDFYLSPSKDEESKQLVLAKATQNAKGKAQTMADNLDVELGRIISASESNYGYRPYTYAMDSNMGSEAVKESTNVLPNDVTVSADIIIVYAIQQK